MGQAKLPSLMTEERLARALSRGGMIVETASGSLRVYRSRDARGRCVGRALGHVVERLLAADQIAARDAGRRGKRYVWIGAKAVCAAGPPPANVLETKAGDRAERVTRQDLLMRVLNMAGEKDEAARIAAAASRYRADIEQAATPQPMTMRWSAAPTSGQRGQGDSFGPGGRAMAAAARLRQVSCGLDVNTLRLIDEVLVRSISAAALGRLLGVPRADVPGLALRALEQLADVYDLRVRGVV